MELRLEPYRERESRLPKTGRHILTQHDDETIVVYQAYRPSKGLAAVRDQRFGGGGWSFDRMSWIKPSFLWMMYRSGWGQKPGQEVVLAIWLRRSAFEEILSQAVISSHGSSNYENHEAWKAAKAKSSVRLQWDPDRSPRCGRLERRAIQLGLRGPVLAAYATEWIVCIEDISSFVAVQRLHTVDPARDRRRSYEKLMLPVENVYPVCNPAIAARIGLSGLGTDKPESGQSPNRVL